MRFCRFLKNSILSNSILESNLQKKAKKQPCLSLSVDFCQDLEIRRAFDSPKINFTLFLDCFFSADCLQLYALALHAWRIEFFFKSHPIFTSDLQCRIRSVGICSFRAFLHVLFIHTHQIHLFSSYMKVSNFVRAGLL